MGDADLRPGMFVLEFGVRQAWPFVGFGNPEGLEVRLYIDTSVQVELWSPIWLAQDDDDLLRALALLNGASVAEVRLLEDGGLDVQFEGGSLLRVLGVANELTTHDVWWVGARNLAYP